MPANIAGTVILFAAVAVLIFVSFNVPLIKSIYFLDAHFADGQYKGELKLGTLGYCLTNGGKETCVGPQVGYDFDPNTIFNNKLPFDINIPKAISKYLTYTLILHPIALAFGGVAFICSLIDIIPGFNMLCFPTCMAGIAGGVCLVAFIFDLAIFFIAKSRISSISGASASVGAAVWMTLAAWVLLGLAGCMNGCACCCGDCRNNGGRDRNRNRAKHDAELDEERDHQMRLQAIRDETRRQKEVENAKSGGDDLPSFQSYEREPLTRQEDDKYLYDEHQPSGGAHNAAVLQGVGMGYGRRTTDDHGYSGGGGYENYSINSATTAGAAGVGSGPAGVVAQHNYGYGQGNNYNDPYHQQQQPYSDHNYNDPYSYPPLQQPQQPPPVPSPPVDHHYGAAAAYYGNQNRVGQDGRPSVESGYHDPGPRVMPADSYSAYEPDDGLDGIGRAATSPGQERQYTGDQGFGNLPPINSHMHSPMGQGQGQAEMMMPTIHTPTPQHLTNNNQPDVLRDGGYNLFDAGPADHGNTLAAGHNTHRPPSYDSAVISPVAVRPEKS